MINNMSARGGSASGGKKIFLISTVFFSLVLLSGCGLKQPDMKTPVGEKGEYNYRNDDLGFSLMLPAEFLYYQTQRKNTPDFVDIEIFVPTNDTKYAQEVPSYAKPVVVRIFNKSFYNGLNVNGDDRKIYQKVGEKNDKVYTIKFWDKIPSDWQGKWNDQMKDNIIKSFQVK